MMFLLCFAALLAGAGYFVTLLRGDVWAFVDWAGLLFLLVPLLGVLTATRSFKVFWGGLRAAILPKEPLAEELRGQAASLFRLLSKATAIAAVSAMLIGFIITLYNMDFSDVSFQSHLARNIAYVLIPPVYGLLLIAGLFEPIVFNLKKRREAGRG